MYQELDRLRHNTLVRRWDAVVRGWRLWILENPLVHPCQRLNPDMVSSLSPFLQYDLALTADGSEVLTGSGVS